MIKELENKFNNYETYINGWQEMKRASIAILIVENNNKDYIVFQVRSKNMRSQPGDISFPGGKIDKGESPLDAVKREVYEEIGLEEDMFKIIAPLDVLTTHYDLLIHPFVGYIKDISKVKISEDEVDHIFLVPLEFLLTHKPLIYDNEIIVKRNESFPYELINNGKQYKFKGGKYPSIFYIYKDYVIWGITAKILQNFLLMYKEL